MIASNEWFDDESLAYTYAREDFQEAIDRGLKSAKDVEQVSRAASSMMIRALADEQPVLLVGAGLSKAARGYPLWSELPPHSAPSRSRESALIAGQLKTTESDVSQIAASTASDDRRRESLVKQWERLANKPQTRKSKTLYRSLLQLPVKRVLTTNWDMEIERHCSLASHDRRTAKFLSEPGDDPWSVTRQIISFTAEPEYARHHAAFACAGPSQSALQVLHAHGSVERPRGMVVTHVDGGVNPPDSGGLGWI
ncbi:MAG: hypothetical protein IT457_11350 [Planctomycetes bacterium]|nr:hypothetical protein [Planctomycetota bacterium]